MKLVVDTSVIVAVIANEPLKAVVVNRTQNADFFAPRLMDYEIGNAFSAMFKRNRISLEQAKRAIEIHRRIPLNLMEVDLIGAIE